MYIYIYIIKKNQGFNFEQFKLNFTKMVYNAKSKKIKKRGEKKVERKRTHNLTKCREKERESKKDRNKEEERETQSRPTGKSSQFFSSARSPEREKAFIAEHCYAARFIPNGQSL